MGTNNTITMAYIKKITVTQEELDSHNGDTLFILDNAIIEFNETFASCERIQTTMNQIGPLEFEIYTTFNVVGELTELEKAILGVNNYSNN